MMKTARNPVIQITLLIVIALSASEVLADGSMALLGQYSMPNPGLVTDVWGYVDPSTNREYALVGDKNRATGVAIIDVTDPSNPTLVSTASDISGFDMKVWGHHLYVVTGTIGSNRARIFDLSDISSPTYAGAFDSAHNIFIDDRGYMYLSDSGPGHELRIFDLNPDPTSPRLLWSDGRQSPHDSYVVGTRLYDFHGAQGTRIYDVTSPVSPVLLGVVATGTYHHSGMPTEDGKHLFVTHEGNRNPLPDITVWNIKDPNDASLVAEITDPGATAHNLYIVGDFAYVSYYTAGFRIYDISDPTQPLLVDEYDTSAWTGESWNGDFGVFPFTPSGNIYVSDIDNGLFVFSFSERATSTFITAFDASYSRGRVRMEWRIGSSNGLLGFNAERADGPEGNFRVLNAELIPVDGEQIYDDYEVEAGKTYWYRLGAVDTAGVTYSRTRSLRVPLPGLVLHDPAPNPFNPATTIAYEIPEAAYVELAIFDAAGQRISTLVDGSKPMGTHSVVWNAVDERDQQLASGVYFVRLAVSGSINTKRVVFLK